MAAGPDPVYCRTDGCPMFAVPCANPDHVAIDGSDGWPPMACGTCHEPVSGDQPAQPRDG